MNAKLEALGLFGLIVLIILVIVVIAIWWWVVWIVAGIIVAHIVFNGGHPVIMQVFVWLVIVSIMAALGRIGYTK